MERLIDILKQNQIEVTWVDENGKVLFGETVHEEAVTFCIPMGEHGQLYFTKQEDKESAFSLLTSAYLSGEVFGKQNTRETFMLGILMGGYDANDPMLSKYGVEEECERCVFVLQPKDDPATILRALSELFSEDKPDVVVSMGNGQISLIKCLRGMEQEDITELCLAIQETARVETGQELMIGVGESRKHLASLDESYREACEALRIGKIYAPQKNLHLYHTLVIERFLQEIPRDVLDRYHQLLFGRRNQRLLNEEMLYTIERFFASDLNLSEAARQLYIHRNTLVYRLDKFQKMTGLDLRRFDDAIVYRMLRIMGDGQIKR